MEHRQNESLFDSETIAVYYAIPNYWNVIFLTIAVFKMYKGIEIGHAVYAVLFADLISTLIHVVILLVAFHSLTSYKYLKLHNSVVGSSLLVHYVCWCTTIVLRYLYVVHEERVYRTIPDMRQHVLIVLPVTGLFAVATYLPIIATAFILGIRIRFTPTCWGFRSFY